ncbi:dihydroxyacetone kinase subunit DhaL [Verrucomicrobiales bacterium]|mgnify:CR=1 FL=1|nr:dihydroxyacetone kinase subunit DhaL [Verrucomicrobiales bacterium]|tara:strand:+ start:1550 stop:2179 length:630 start_codon:yes stop_codon:yes gene_type:complete
MAKETLSINETRDMMLAVADKIIESEPILSEADRALGDGDHGVGMERGMNAVKEALEGEEFACVGKVFMGVGMAMMSSMGGASGAVFGMLFRGGGKSIKGSETLGAAEVASFFKEGTDEVMTKGGAKAGDKTMVDALLPCAEGAAGAQGNVSEALAGAAAGAEAGKEASKAMIATMGRAKTLGEKSVGLPDAGAVSVAIIAATMRDFAA